MSQAVEHLAELTGFRDRDLLDVTLVGAFRDLLQSFCEGRGARRTSISPLVDPHKGVRPAQARCVTVLAPTCALADGLTKIVGLRDTASLPVLRMLDAHAAILDTPDTLQVTDGFWQQLVQPPSIGPALHV